MEKAKKDAKESAATAALLQMQNHDKYFKHFLINIPPDSDGNPTNTLLQFFQMHSIHKHGDELQGIYKSYMKEVNGAAGPAFECRLIFKTVELGNGKGDTKRRAREDASRQVLRRLRTGIMMLEKDSVVRLCKYANVPVAASVIDPHE